MSLMAMFVAFAAAAACLVVADLFSDEAKRTHIHRDRVRWTQYNTMCVGASFGFNALAFSFSPFPAWVAVTGITACGTVGGLLLVGALIGVLIELRSSSRL